ncbi:hypothetical protein ANN_24684 [Periplaneta americana]|uniref:Myb/SANT-like DNA-binding domain-containing protein n=1 Tax=Periplaneta americana TaxID=6978 RepID=A0ABQ8S3Q7_PERAM|nr:hypothetical protein ANN_24684 [Periplaneta americana]
MVAEFRVEIVDGEFKLIVRARSRLKRDPKQLIDRIQTRGKESEQELKLNVESGKQEILWSERNCVFAETRNETPSIEVGNMSKIQQEDENGFHWTTASTLLLIRVREEVDPEFQKPKCKKNKLWNVVRDRMCTSNYNVSAIECDRKWRNLLTTYKRRKDTSRKSGEGALPFWEFEATMDAFMGDKPNIEPPRSHLVSTLPQTDHTSPTDTQQNILQDISTTNNISAPARNWSPIPSTSTSSPDIRSPSPHRQFSSTPSSSSNNQRRLSRKRKDDSPPRWFREYMEKKEVADNAKFRKMQELEEQKIQAINELTSVMKQIINKKTCKITGASYGYERLRPDEDKMALYKQISFFVSDFKKRWQQARRIEEIFLEKNKDWLDSSNPALSASITGVDIEIIRTFNIILQVISCGHEIDVEKFRKYAFETAQLFVRKYSWYVMPPTIHKILINGPEIIRHAIVPIGQLSEEAQEARNKEFKKYR